MHIGRGWEVSWGPEDCNGNAKMHCQCKLGVSTWCAQGGGGCPKIPNRDAKLLIISSNFSRLIPSQCSSVEHDPYAHPCEQQTGWWKQQGSMVGTTNDKAKSSAS